MEEMSGFANWVLLILSVGVGVWFFGMWIYYALVAWGVLA